MVNYSHDAVLTIDGSYGEGGGQILRTSLALSCVLGRPVRINNIRKARAKPGLQPQHLTAINAAAAVSHARVEGATLSSTEVSFSPGPIAGGDYTFDVAEKRGSAGSSSLVLQTVILPLCFAKQPSTVTALGGTHVPWSPSFHYLKNVFLPALSRVGVSIDLNIEKWGWYPLGGGKVVAVINPIRTFLSAVICERGKLRGVRGISAVSNLPREIAVCQRDAALAGLKKRDIHASVEIVSAPSAGKGTYVFLLAELDGIAAGFDALGAPGKRAEDVAEEACRALYEHLDTAGALDPHLADQILPYLALAGRASEFTTSRITRHLLTNIWVVKQFVRAAVFVEGEEGKPGRVLVLPNGTDERL